MDWVVKMNGVMNYVEEHLCDEINSEAISRIMACPFSIFQRSFSQKLRKILRRQ